MADISSEQKEKLQKAFKFLQKLFGLNALYQHQQDGLTAVLSGKDCFIAQPTGSGKSFIYQSLPIFFDIMGKINLECDSNNEIIYDSKSCRKVVLVVSPLVGLMKDQVSSLSKKGIANIFVTQQHSYPPDVSNSFT